MGVKVHADKDKPGRWWVRVNHQGKRKSLAFHDRATAKRTAQEIERRLKLGELGLDAAPTAPTFAAYADTWLASAETRLRPATVEQVRSRLRRVLPTLGPVPLTAITRQTVRDLVGTIQAQGSRRVADAPIARATLRAVLNTVSVILGQALEDGVIPSNPCARLGKLLPKGKTDDTAEVEVFTPRELAHLLDLAEREFAVWAPFVLTLARTGLRLGEAVALEWRDVDVPSRVLLVRRSQRRGRVGLPKNGKPRRVDMTPQLTACLAGLRSLQAAEAALEGRAAPERCFPGQNDEDAWRRRDWTALLRRAGLRYRKPHTLRHTYASLLLERRESLLYVQQQLGHHSPAFTLSVYAHLIPRDGHRAVDALDLPHDAHASASPAQAHEVTPQDSEPLVNHSR
jgi:integrase